MASLHLFSAVFVEGRFSHIHVPGPSSRRNRFSLQILFLWRLETNSCDFRVQKEPPVPPSQPAPFHLALAVVSAYYSDPTSRLFPHPGGYEKARFISKKRKQQRIDQLPYMLPGTCIHAVSSIMNARCRGPNQEHERTPIM